jgi:hypothetical protein
MEAWKWWDRSMHYLFSVDPQAFLDLLLGEGQVRYLAHLPEKLEGDRAIVDTLLDTEIIEDGSFLLVHLESETRKDSKMGERLLEYNQKVRKKYKYKRDVLSGVFHLGNDAELKSSPLLWGTPLRQWSRTLEFCYPVVEMKYLTPRGIRRRGRIALLPLLPLTEGGAEWDVVQGVLHDLEFEDRELLKIAFGMAMRRVSEEHRESLKKEYHMIYDELRADPLFREMLDDERKEGIQKMQEGLIALVARDFSELEFLARTKITAIDSWEHLQHLILDLTLLHTHEEMEQFLLALNGH